MFQAAFQVVAAEVVAEVADTGEVAEVATVVEVEAAGKAGEGFMLFFCVRLSATLLSRCCVLLALPLNYRF